MDRFEKALAKSRDRKPVDNRSVAPTSAPLEGTVSASEKEVSITSAAAFPIEDSGLIALKFKDPMADLFRMLRTQVLKGLAKRKATTLGLCSARAGEGKTFIAANLSASIALSQENSVLLIDLDLRRPGVHKLFKVDPRPGVTDFLAGSATLTECVRSATVPGLQILPAGAPIQNSSEALGSSELAKAVAELRQTMPARIVICDLPPLLSSDDALMFSSKIDAILFVVEEGRTRPGELQRSLELLGPPNVLGTVLNKSKYNNPFPYSTYDISSV